MTSSTIGSLSGMTRPRTSCRDVPAITARATQHLSRFNLDLDGALEVASARVDGRSARLAHEGDELRVTPSRGIRKGAEFVVVIRYAGIPQTLPDGSGFIHTDDGALVVGQPHVADTWFPANGSSGRSGLVHVSSERAERPRGRRKRSAGRHLDARGLDDLEVGRARTDGHLSRRDGHRRAGDQQLPGGWDQVLGCHRPGPPARITPTDGTQYAYSQVARPRATSG